MATPTQLAGKAALVIVVIIIALATGAVTLALGIKAGLIFIGGVVVLGVGVRLFDHFYNPY